MAFRSYKARCKKLLSRSARQWRPRRRNASPHDSLGRRLAVKSMEYRKLLSLQPPLLDFDPAVVDVNVPPVAADDAYSMGNNQQLGAGVLANDSDPDGDHLTVVLGDGPTNGKLQLQEDGLFTYKPDAGFEGVDSFTYSAYDGQASSQVATVRVSVALVNQVPQAADDGYVVQQGGSLVVQPETGLLANDADVDGDTLSASLVDGPANGTVTLNPDGSFEYAPNADFHGSDSFTYTAGDGQAASNLATVNITIEAVNDAPVAADDAYTVSEDGTLAVQPETGLLANDSDVDGDTLSATLVDGPANGTVTLNPDGSFEYAPNADFNGSDSFTYTAGDGQAASNLTTVNITIEAVNDAPVAADDAYTVSEDGTLSGESGLLANDSDVDGDTLSASLVDGPANGTVTLNPDGSFEYAPNGDFHGSDSFTYTAGDGQAASNLATVTIQVNHADLKVHLEISGTAFGSDAGQHWAGSTFWLNSYVEDLRAAAQGVVGEAIDVQFDATVVVPTGNVVYGAQFAAFQQGQADAVSGMIDEAGALATVSGVGANGLAPFMAWEFVRVGSLADAQQVQLTADPGEGTATITPANFALVGDGTPVDWNAVDFDSVNLALRSGDFNDDGLLNQFDLAVWLPRAGSAPGDPRFDAEYDLNNDSQIDQLDLDILLEGMFGYGQPQPSDGGPAADLPGGDLA